MKLHTLRPSNKSFVTLALAVCACLILTPRANGNYTPVTLITLEVLDAATDELISDGGAESTSWPVASRVG